MKLKSLIASLIAVSALTSTAHATQYVTNGNFSSLTNGLGELNHDTVATGWSTTGYNFVMNVGDVGSNGSYGNLPLWDAANGGASSWNGMSPTGDNFVAMDGDFSVSPVQQTLTGLTVGQTYNFSFDYAFSQQRGYTGSTVQSISASLDGVAVATAPLYTLPSSGFSGWTTYTGTVTATSTSELLSFLAYGDTPVPPFALLTDVSLTSAVPEPASWAMMIVGLGAMGVVARRRRQVIATA